MEGHVVYKLKQTYLLSKKKKIGTDHVKKQLLFLKVVEINKRDLFFKCLTMKMCKK